MPPSENTARGSLPLPEPRVRPRDVRAGSVQVAIAAPQVSVADQLSHARTRVGRTLCDRWHLDTLLAVGGMASVYAATHRNGNRVAIKILHPELSAYEELKERFLEEGYAANNVAHPGVVSIHDDGTSEDGAVFLVMELLEGETLQARCQSAPCAFSHKDALSIADQILDVLEAAHRRGIIHRDIKPENIFLTNKGEIKLLDFGIAHNDHSRRTHRTQAGSAMGTPAFMPPEQARGRADQIDGRTDIWALGATLFWLVSGRCVRSAETSNEELLQAMTRPAPALSEVAPDAPPLLARLIDTALAFERDERFADANAMRVALRETYAALADGESCSLPPFDPSVQLAAVLLPESDQSPVGLSQASPSTYRPVATSSEAAAPAKGSRGRLRALASLCAALAIVVTATALLWNSARGGAGTAERAIQPVPELRHASAASNDSRTATDNEPASAGAEHAPRLNAEVPRPLVSKSPASDTRSTPRAAPKKRTDRLAAKPAPATGPTPSSPSISSAAFQAAPSQRDPLSRRK
jgi:eukaryotic-like serine/threonine-protein kinase